MKTISFEIPEGLDRQVRIVAAQLDLNRSEFIRQALEEKLKQRQATIDAEIQQQALRATSLTGLPLDSAVTLLSESAVSQVVEQPHPGA